MTDMPEEPGNTFERYLQEQQEDYFINQYWMLVKRTLFEILNQNNRDELTREVDNLRALVISRPIEEQMLFYHAEPLDVAVDLLGRKTANLQEEEIDNYLRLVNNNTIDNLDQ